MTDRSSELDNYCRQESQAGAKSVAALKIVSSASAPPIRRRKEPDDSGIQVREEPLAAVSAQRMYKMRCECGRSWFELVCGTIVQCPACKRLGLIAIQ
jgi:hypothetical protein